MANRKNVSSLSDDELKRFRRLLDVYINKPTDNPVAEHLASGMDMSLDIHGAGFIAWHQHFLARLDNWLIINNGDEFVPCPYWDPAKPIPPQLDANNTDVNMPLPNNLSQPALAEVFSYTELNNRIVPYHGAVHNAAGGMMPSPMSSPSDPIFWPFHAFLVSVYEHWRNL
jgi:Common central domain of tyrosinase